MAIQDDGEASFVSTAAASTAATKHEQEQPAQEQQCQRRRYRSWNETVATLKQYRARHGNCRVPWEYPEDPALARWVHSVRSRQSRLSLVRLEQLNGVGFSWDPLDDRWQEQFQRVRDFYRLRGHCRIPRSYDGQRTLSTWVCFQRELYHKGKLADKYIQQLNSIGFVWGEDEEEEEEAGDATPSSIPTPKPVCPSCFKKKRNVKHDHSQKKKKKKKQKSRHDSNQCHEQDCQECAVDKLLREVACCGKGAACCGSHHNTIVDACVVLVPLVDRLIQNINMTDEKKDDNDIDIVMDANVKVLQNCASFLESKIPTKANNPSETTTRVRVREGLSSTSSSSSLSPTVPVPHQKELKEDIYNRIMSLLVDLDELFQKSGGEFLPVIRECEAHLESVLHSVLSRKRLSAEGAIKETDGGESDAPLLLCELEMNQEEHDEMMAALEYCCCEDAPSKQGGLEAGTFFDF